MVSPPPRIHTAAGTLFKSCTCKTAQAILQNQGENLYSLTA